MALRNQVQLITYPDSLGGDLKTLGHVLEVHFPDAFPGGLHILPPFPSSGDRGFAPLTYLEIEPDFGDWSDIRTLAERGPLLLDLMVNHISAQSDFFQSFLTEGSASPYADLFLTLDKVWPGGEINDGQFKQVFLRRTNPVSEFSLQSNGSRAQLWTTFGKVTPSEQIDFDYRSPTYKNLLLRFLDNFAEQGVRILRLDAVGYLVKKPGTSFFFVEPEIHDFLEWIAAEARSRNIEILPEVHSEYAIQEELTRRGYWIYDFILPYRVLEALLLRDATRLATYLRERPHNQFTMLDCHDGVPVKPDLNGLYEKEAVNQVVESCLQRGGNLSKIFSPQHRDSDGFDVHQIRGSYYSLLGADDDAYIAARAIQLFSPGIPQIYYVGLLAGENDHEFAAQTGEGRDINRHNYTLSEIEAALGREVVERLLKLIAYRNQSPFFEGQFSARSVEPQSLELTWQKGGGQSRLQIDLANMSTRIWEHDPDGTRREISL